mmetsp:Transcript_32261/g.126246  ORF Transcript_32261/g.126246 Transcript_32261/m.126246 type:complete len:86 (+) Transcript_32261:2243-2500(+)
MPGRLCRLRQSSDALLLTVIKASLEFERLKLARGCKEAVLFAPSRRRKRKRTKAFPSRCYAGCYVLDNSMLPFWSIPRDVSLSII